MNSRRPRDHRLEEGPGKLRPGPWAFLGTRAAGGGGPSSALPDVYIPCRPVISTAAMHNSYSTQAVGLSGTSPSGAPEKPRGPVAVLGSVTFRRNQGFGSAHAGRRRTPIASVGRRHVFLFLSDRLAHKISCVGEAAGFLTKGPAVGPSPVGVFGHHRLVQPPGLTGKAGQVARDSQRHPGEGTLPGKEATWENGRAHQVNLPAVRC